MPIISLAYSAVAASCTSHRARPPRNTPAATCSTRLFRVWPRARDEVIQVVIAVGAQVVVFHLCSQKFGMCSSPVGGAASRRQTCQSTTCRMARLRSEALHIWNVWSLKGIGYYLLAKKNGKPSGFPFFIEQSVIRSPERWHRSPLQCCAGSAPPHRCGRCPARRSRTRCAGDAPARWSGPSRRTSRADAPTKLKS